MIKKQLLFAAALLPIVTIAAADLYIEPLPVGYTPPFELLEPGSNGEQRPIETTESGETDNSDPELEQSRLAEKQEGKTTDLK